MAFHWNKAYHFLEQTGLDGLLLVSRDNKFYTAELYSGSGYVLVTGKGGYAIVDGRYYVQQKERMKKTSGVGAIHASALLADEACGFFEHINRICENDGVKKLGFEKEAVTFGQYEKFKSSLGVELVPVSPDVIRVVKDEDELACIRRACEIADKGYSYIITQIKAGMTEKQVENKLLYFMKEQGAQKESFDIIVASGVNGAKPHAKASDKVIEAGDFVTMDFGARFGEYCSDITRTVAVEYAGKEMSQIYEIVRRAQAAAIQAVRPGKICREIDRVAREIIHEAGYGREFSHNLGHSVGIACHETPVFSRTDETVLVPGMVMTVEPGIYVEGLGGVRIEDDILVTEDGCRVLTSSKKDLTVVG